MAVSQNLPRQHFWPLNNLILGIIGDCSSSGYVWHFGHHGPFCIQHFLTIIGACSSFENNFLQHFWMISLGNIFLWASCAYSIFQAYFVALGLILGHHRFTHYRNISYLIFGHHECVFHSALSIFGNHGLASLLDIICACSILGHHKHVQPFSFSSIFGITCAAYCGHHMCTLHI